jgi:hypothetical protein
MILFTCATEFIGAGFSPHPEIGGHDCGSGGDIQSAHLAQALYLQSSKVNEG